MHIYIEHVVRTIIFDRLERNMSDRLNATWKLSKGHPTLSIILNQQSSNLPLFYVIYIINLFR